MSLVIIDFHHLEYDLFSLSAKKWHWRARTSALYFSQTIPMDHDYVALFTSSVLPLAELLGVRPDLQKCKKIVYFHENQLVYPRQEIKKERDCQYGLNQIMTCLAADEIIFNSKFNMTSFLDNINSFLNIQSDYKPRNIKEKILIKSEVLYFPIQFEYLPQREPNGEENSKKVLNLVWPHRWEHDKNPQLLTNVLQELNKRQADFKISILGQNSQVIPDCFVGLREELGNKLVHFGFLTKDEYFKTLLSADVVISTAGHEFYGVSMLEATFCGCVPIAPNKLVYPEIYPPENLYNTSNQLLKVLYNWSRNRNLFNAERERFFMRFNFEKYSAKTLIPQFIKKLKPIELSGVAAHIVSPTIIEDQTNLCG